MTCDIWHMTCDMWHGTHDRWGEVNLLPKCQLPCFYGLGVKVFWRYFYKGWETQLTSDKGVCRTALATPGLLNIIPNRVRKSQISKHFEIALLVQKLQLQKCWLGRFYLVVELHRRGSATNGATPLVIITLCQSLSPSRTLELKSSVFTNTMTLTLRKIYWWFVSLFITLSQQHIKKPRQSVPISWFL